MKGKNLATSGIVAALYVVLTTAFSALSFGAIQIRFASSLYQLCAYNRKYFWGLVIGVFVANMFSPLGMLDLLFGVATTVVGLGVPILINRKISNDFAQKLTIAAGVTLATVLVAVELNMVYHLPVFQTWMTVAAGQAITQVIGIPLFAAINSRLALAKAFKE